MSKKKKNKNNSGNGNIEYPIVAHDPKNRTVFFDKTKTGFKVTKNDELVYKGNDEETAKNAFEFTSHDSHTFITPFED